MELNFLEQLNDSQRMAVEYCDGPSLVIAGAGSGKTRVLTYKIAYLLAKGLKPWEILALTFTNKAANEMKQRIGSLVGNNQARYLQMGTFHSIFSRILRKEAAVLGYANNFTIYDESDSRSLLKAIVKELQLDDKLYKPAAVHARISMAKNRLLLPDQYASDVRQQERDVAQRMPRLAEVYKIYCDRCRQANAMDFDDLLTNTYLLLCQNEEVRQRYATQYRYILVDEYQDTNSVQQKIVWLLSKDHLHVCAVGDDAQSIYAFRGANIDNILDFQKVFAGTQLFKLEQNYRSTQRIVDAANSLIKHNQRQIPKEVYSKNELGDKLIVKPSYSDKEEAFIVCNEIKRLHRVEHAAFSDFAILYRTNSQSRSFEEAMRKVSIPYKIFGGLSFYQRKEIKDVIAYFRVVVNPNDEEAFKRIINYPKRGLGDTTVNKILATASAANISLWQVACHPMTYGLKLSKATENKLVSFVALITHFQEQYHRLDAYELGVKIVKESGISAEIYHDKDPENVSRQENLEELLSGMQDFVEGRREEGRMDEARLDHYLQEVSLLTDLESGDDAQEEKVSLMTVHSAKGLEFPIVFVVGMDENIFPSLQSVDNPRQLEEERRLFYVAITRAERHCILTFARSRFRYGKVESETPSRFLRDIDSSLLEVEDERDIFMRSSNRLAMDKGPSSSLFAAEEGRISSNSRYGNDYRQRENAFSQRETHSTFIPSDHSYSRGKYQNSNPVAFQFKADPKPRVVMHHEDAPVTDTFSPRFQRLRNLQSMAHERKVAKSVQQSFNKLAIGAIIEHERFGIGEIRNIEGTGENAKATVQFKNVGEKQLLLKFARFKVIQ